MNKVGSIKQSNIRKFELVFKSAKKLICYHHGQYPLPILLLGVECTKMVAFNALTSGHMHSCVNQVIKLICDLPTQYSLPIIPLDVECTKMIAFNALTLGHMNSC